MAFPNYTNIFSGGGTQTPQTPLAGSLSSLFSDYAKFKEASGGSFKEEDFLPFAIFMQQRNADRMNDPANITRQLEAMEAPLGRMARDAATLQAQKDMRSLTGNLVTKAADTLTASLGAKFAYDQPVFNAIGGAYNPNPYAYGVLNRRGGVA
jgi:hypothetical protein